MLPTSRSTGDAAVPRRDAAPARPGAAALAATPAPLLALTPAMGLALMFTLGLAPGTAGAQPATTPPLAVGAATTPGICADVMRRLTGVTLPVRNAVHTEYQPFVLSKPLVEPLETQQYLQYEDEARTRPTMLMCKSKSADHVVAVHGPGTARTDLATTCRDVNRDIVLGVWATLAPAERAAARATPQRILLEADDVKLTGSRWITPHQFAWRDADGRTHLQARRLRADWTDWRWRLAPDGWRGTYYCQLASPEYVRRLMLGQVTPPPRAAAD